MMGVQYCKVIYSDGCWEKTPCCIGKLNMHHQYCLVFLSDALPTEVL